MRGDGSVAAELEREWSREEIVELLRSRREHAVA
jgi:hypothetical protein